MSDLKKVVIAFDSFKGCMSSRQANAAGARAVRAVMPSCQVTELPMADGGEGSANALAEALHCMPVTLPVTGALGNSLPATYYYNDEQRLAVMDAAQACGIARIEISSLDPLRATSRGVGEMIADAVKRGAKKIIIGLGGSATNDGGMGMLSSLGGEFRDTEGNLLQGCGKELGKAVTTNCSEVSRTYADVEFIVLCDVKAPLLGKHGATYTFGPQKGADSATLARLERDMQNYSSVLIHACHTRLSKPETKETEIDLINTPGTGAAGGLGFALATALNAKLTSGIRTILDYIEFDRHLLDCDLVITGEGKMDAQTAMGKTAQGILERANKYNIPVIAFCGSIIDLSKVENLNFLSATCIQNNIISLKEAMNRDTAEVNLYYNILQQLKLIKYFKK